jgi:drug/metabolite transporter (DMT)-like permease
MRQGSVGYRGPTGPLLDATLVAALVAAAIGAALGEFDPFPSPAAQGWLILLAGTSQVLGWLLISVSLPRLPAVMTSLLLTIQPVGSLAFAALILGEAPSWVQLLGAATILAGLVVASRGGVSGGTGRGAGRRVGQTPDVSEGALPRAYVASHAAAAERTSRV